MNLDFSVVVKYFPLIIAGLKATLQYSVMAAFFGFILGVLLAVAKISNVKPIRWLCAFYTSIFRGTPLLVQLSMVYLAIPSLTGIKLSAVEAGVLALSLNSAAYISEIFRGGINAIDKGQYEAAKSLGVSYFDMMKDIIIPQAVKHILPGLVNQTITIVKDTSLLAYIGVMDLLRAAEQITVNTYRYFEPYLAVALVYYVIVLILSALAKTIERKMAND